MGLGVQLPSSACSNNCLISRCAAGPDRHFRMQEITPAGRPIQQHVPPAPANGHPQVLCHCNRQPIVHRRVRLQQAAAGGPGQGHVSTDRRRNQQRGLLPQPAQLRLLLFLLQLFLVLLQLPMLACWPMWSAACACPVTELVASARQAGGFTCRAHGAESRRPAFNQDM